MGESWGVLSGDNRAAVAEELSSSSAVIEDRLRHSDCIR